MCLAAAALVVFGAEFRFFRAPDPRVLLEVRDDIRTVEDLDQWPQGHGRFMNEGFVSCATDAWTESGWCLPAGQSGSLRYVLPGLPGGRSILMRLFFFRRDAQAKSRLAVSREGDAAPRLVLENPYFADARLDLSSVLAAPGGPVVVSFEGENPTGHPDVIVQYFETRVFAEPLPAAPSVWRMTLAVAALGFAALLLVPWKTWLPLCGALSVGFALRYAALLQVLWLPLDWDAAGLHQMARKMQLFTDTGFFSAQFGAREPLFLLALKGMLAVLGDAETHVRLTSLLASLVVIGLTYRLARRLFGRSLGLAGALVVALCLPLVRESVRGLRLEAEIIGLLVLVEMAFLRRFRSRWVQAVACGLVAGFLSLLRTNYLFTVPLLLALAFRPWAREGLLAMALAGALIIGLQWPHRFHGYQLYRDWTWDNNAQWWANTEFAGRAGWPSRLDVWRNPERGPKVYSWQYFFGLHSLRELALGNLRGAWKIIRHMEVVAFHRGLRRRLGIDLAAADALFQLAGCAGLLLAFATRGWRWLPATLAALLMHLPFLYDRGLVEAWRHTYHVFPFFVFGALFFCWAAGRRLRNLEPLAVPEEARRAAGIPPAAF